MNDAEKISDLIVVGELTGYKTDVWQFPDRLSCPLRSCRLTFDTRELAIVHYTESHAQHVAMCPVCKVPKYLLYGPHHLESHYKRMHPTLSPPVKVKQIQVNTCERLQQFTVHFSFNLKQELFIFYSIHCSPSVQFVSEPTKAITYCTNTKLFALIVIQP